jgi:hypothetical protein
MVGGPQRDSPEGPSPAGPSPSTNSNSLVKTDTGHTIGRFKLRGQSDDLPQYVPCDLNSCGLEIGVGK